MNPILKISILNMDLISKITLSIIPKLVEPTYIKYIMLEDDPKLSGDSGEVPIMNGMIGSIPAMKPSLYLTGK